MRIFSPRFCSDIWFIMVVVVSELWCCHNNLTCTQHLATKTSNCAPLATTLLATAPRLSYNARTALSEPFCTCQQRKTLRQKALQTWIGLVRSWATGRCPSRLRPHCQGALASCPCCRLALFDTANTLAILLAPQASSPKQTCSVVPVISPCSGKGCDTP